jgi:hypothetical protein
MDDEAKTGLQASDARCPTPRELLMRPRETPRKRVDELGILVIHGRVVRRWSGCNFDQ